MINNSNNWVPKRLLVNYHSNADLTGSDVCKGLIMNELQRCSSGKMVSKFIFHPLHLLQHCCTYHYCFTNFSWFIYGMRPYVTTTLDCVTCHPWSSEITQSIFPKPLWFNHSLGLLKINRSTLGNLKTFQHSGKKKKKPEQACPLF